MTSDAEPDRRDQAVPAGSASLEQAEHRYATARQLRDQLEVARARGQHDISIAERAVAAARDAILALHAASGDDLGAADSRAIHFMRQWLHDASATAQADADTPAGGEPGIRDGLEKDLAALSGQILDAYAAATTDLVVGHERLSRLAVLGRLSTEPDGNARRELFLALEPAWLSIAGDGSPDAPYRRLLRLSAARWADGHSPVAANATALGITPASIEPTLVEILQAWRDATASQPPVEPWDWWYANGAAERALGHAIPPERMFALSADYCAALGADLERLDVSFDVTARPGRPPVPVAYTTFGGRPGAASDQPGAGPWVFATYSKGGLGELTELIHETGHAIHIASIRTRPAFADWPDSDALTEALAELVALDTAEPAWQECWLGASAPEGTSLRDRYSDVMLDVCWALFEIRLHAEPGRHPGDVWSELTSAYLNIVPHPEWPWWAMRGQLADEPGYMANYAIAAILAADLRAAIRAERGDWTGGDPGWYGWVSERIYRYGLERTSGDVLRDVLGREPSAQALLAELARAR